MLCSNSINLHHSTGHTKVKGKGYIGRKICLYSEDNFFVIFYYLRKLNCLSRRECFQLFHLGSIIYKLSWKCTLEGVSSLTSKLHYLWKSLSPFSLSCAQKWRRKTSIIIIIVLYWLIITGFQRLIVQIHGRYINIAR